MGDGAMIHEAPNLDSTSNLLMIYVQCLGIPLDQPQFQVPMLQAFFEGPTAN